MVDAPAGIIGTTTGDRSSVMRGFGGRPLFLVSCVLVTGD